MCYCHSPQHSMIHFHYSLFGLEHFNHPTPQQEYIGIADRFSSEKIKGQLNSRQLSHGLGLQALQAATSSFGQYHQIWFYSTHDLCFEPCDKPILITIIYPRISNLPKKRLCKFLFNMK